MPNFSFQATGSWDYTVRVWRLDHKSLKKALDESIEEANKKCEENSDTEDKTEIISHQPAEKTKDLGKCNQEIDLNESNSKIPTATDLSEATEDLREDTQQTDHSSEKDILNSKKSNTNETHSDKQKPENESDSVITDCNVEPDRENINKSVSFNEVEDEAFTKNQQLDESKKNVRLLENIPEMQTLEGHTGNVRAVAFSRIGMMVG